MIGLRGRDRPARPGFDSFVDYAYRLRERFDYGVAEAVAFQEAIDKVVVPLARPAPGGTVERPWASRRSAPGTSPSTRSAGRRSGRSATSSNWPRGPRRSSPTSIPSWARSSPTSGRHGLLDLANRKGKAPGGYQTTLEDDRLPFIFMNAVGVDGDVRTLLHEGGHAFHALASRGEPLAAYRESPIEFCEVASMSMELLGARNLGEFYGEDDANRSYRQLLEGIVLILPWIATVDAFQHWIYAHPGHTRDERRAAWTACSTGSAGPSTGRATRTPARTAGTGSCTSSSTRSITSNTGSPSSEPCRSGGGACVDRAGAVAGLPPGPGDRRGPAACPSCSRPPGRSSSSPSRDSGR